MVQGLACNWLELLEKGVNAHSYLAKIVDPNTLETRTYEGHFMPLPPSSGNAIYSHCVKQEIKNLASHA
jgi:hypothetical protein